MSDKKILIPYVDDACHPAFFEIKESLLGEVVNFVIESYVSLVCAHYFSKKNIIVCLPNYLIDLIKEKACRKTAVSNGNLMIAGLKCQISYENKVTVFYNAYLPQEIIKYTKDL